MSCRMNSFITPLGDFNDTIGSLLSINVYAPYSLDTENVGTYLKSA